MHKEKRRYFIELQPEGGITPPRAREAEVRRAQAAQFISDVHNWLKQEELEDKVAAMAVTALGQVQITCEAGLISQLRSYGETDIAAIRPAAPFDGNLDRLG